MLWQKVYTNAYTLESRDELRNSIADAVGLGDTSVDVQSASDLACLTIEQAKELWAMLARRARDLNSALKLHQQAVAKITEKNYSLNAFWPE